jgi:hypothetical protein
VKFYTGPPEDSREGWYRTAFLKYHEARQFAIDRMQEESQDGQVAVGNQIRRYYVVSYYNTARWRSAPNFEAHAADIFKMPRGPKRRIPSSAAAAA